MFFTIGCSTDIWQSYEYRYIQFLWEITMVIHHIFKPLPSHTLQRQLAFLLTHRQDQRLSLLAFFSMHVEFLPKYINVSNSDGFSVANMYLDHLKLCVVCINGLRYICCSVMSSLTSVMSPPIDLCNLSGALC